MKRNLTFASAIATAAAVGALIALPAGSAASSPAPVLGSAKAFPSGKGFGKVKPTTVFLGGDPTGLFKSVTWAGWGASKSTGSGQGYYPPPGKPTADAVKVPVTLVASSLGQCHGHRAYRKLAVSFEYKGHSHAGSKLNICS
jgi:hypothetical protein